MFDSNHTLQLISQPHRPTIEHKRPLGPVPVWWSADQRNGYGRLAADARGRHDRYAHARGAGSDANVDVKGKT